MNDRLLSFVGICRRARRLQIGAEVCVKSLREGKARLIIFASDFSRGSLKPVEEEARKRGVDVLQINRTKQELSFALGKLCGVMAVEDDGFASKLRTMIEDEQGGEFYGKVQG